MIRTSEYTDKVWPALFKAAQAFKPVAFDKANTHLKSKYATLPAHLDAVKPALVANGLILTQGTSAPVVSVETRITHAESGQWIASDYPVHPIKADPQAEGSALTYARRYAISALLALAAEDDDGNAASAAVAMEEVRAMPPPQKGFDRARYQEVAEEYAEDFKVLCEHLDDGDLDSAYSLWHAIGQEAIGSVWFAPTKLPDDIDPIFTTKHRAILRSPEWSAARSRFHEKEKAA